MRDIHNRGMLEKLKLVVKVLVLALLLVFFWWLLFAEKDNSIGMEVNQDINLTPEQIQSIRAIGEWEFLAVSDEELVDTVRKRLFGNDQLARIYYGTVRIGIDMKQLDDHWLQAHGDTVVVTLPKVGLLDRDFIDEARTKAFYESGSWTATDREALFRKAYRQMLAHCLTPQNLRSAEQNGEAQVRRMMAAMGYSNITVRFGS